MARPATTAPAAPARLTVSVDRATASVSPRLYGLMTEEISHAYDGGLYAELVQNRRFRDHASEPLHWALVQAERASGRVSLEDGALKLSLDTASADARVGVANDGFWGIPLRPATTYRATVLARADKAMYRVKAAA